jgi:hypothetical protein
MGIEASFAGWSLSDKIAAIASLAAFLQFAALLATIAITLQTSRRQLRAYVLPESGGLWDGTTLTPPSPGRANEPGVTLFFKNSGQTPAYKFVSWAQIAVCEPENGNKLVAPKLQLQSPATLGAGGVITKSIWFNRTLTPQEIADIGAATKYIFVYGRLEYRDAFRRKRWANFRLQYAGKFPPVTPVVYNFSDAGNVSN